MDAEKLKAILASHAQWVGDNRTGSRAGLREADLRGAGLREADLRGADLREADLYGADLREADLREADLSGADLREADLTGADLFGANLSGANLFGANLREAILSRANLYEADLREAILSRANLYEADLREADLREANLYEADLSGADLSRANLRGANLRGANLTKTVLDPTNKPNGMAKEFRTYGKSKYVIGYRTRKTPHIGEYRDKRIYAADFFSTADMECHPGLYLWPTLQHAREFSGNVNFIKVRTKRTDIHQAGDKWRCRWFEVIGAAK